MTLPTTMRAAVLHHLDTAPTLDRVPVPTPAADEVLVQVAASSVNPHDAMVASGGAARYLDYDFPVVLGTDVAGTVAAVGEAIDDLAVGDRVFGLLRERIASRGTFAEFAAVPRAMLARTPDDVSDPDAGSIGLAAVTAIRCVDAASLAPGDTALVVGAAGGVGSCVVQLLTVAGVQVIATGRAPQRERLTGLGADEVIDWTTGDVARSVAVNHPNGVTALIELASRDGEAVARLAGETVTTGGRVVSPNHAAAAAGDRYETANVIAVPDPATVERIAAALADGSLRADIGKSFGLDQFGDALEALRGTDDRHGGKIGIRVG